MKKYLLAYTLLIIGTILVFSKTLKNDFVEGHDDSIHISQNQLLNPVTFEGLKQFWVAPHENLYIPLTYSFWSAGSILSRYCFSETTQPNPLVFHALNLLLHCLNIGLVLLLLLELRCTLTGAWIGAAIFALHPIQVEPVAWASGTKDLLAVLFSLLSIYFYLHSLNAKQRIKIVLAFLCFIMAMLSKPSSIFLPAVIFVLLCGFQREKAQRALPILGLWLIVGLYFGYLTISSQPSLNIHGIPDLPKRILVSLDTVSFYLRKICLPRHFTVEYGRTPEVALKDTYLTLWLALPIALTIALLVFRKMRLQFWSYASFLLSLIPVLGIIPFHHQNFSTVADRYAYMSMFSVSLGLGVTFRSLNLNRALIVFFALTTISFASYRQVPVWKNEVTVFEHALTVNPSSWVSHHLLGIAMGRRKNFDEAIFHFQEVIKRHPTMVEAYLKWQKILKLQGKEREAEAVGNLANRAAAEALMEEGDALTKAKRYSEAGGRYYGITLLFPNSAEAYLKLAKSQLTEGNLSAGLENYKMARTLNPSIRDEDAEKLVR